MRSGSITDDQGKLNNFAIEPEMYLTEEAQTGFTPYAELLNGRLAMIGFVSLLALEFFTGHGLLGFFQTLSEM
ncbi:MAG: high light inducible protein [Leptolyngbyaceae cyanobacterium CSU_1_3]|jgi:Chlorophyll A-B binding protein|nr:high light inducible protein [Leptolyngbyaceae cyanobacterium CSU_1_3]